jgi:phosphate-selective porin OprO/OprP
MNGGLGKASRYLAGAGAIGLLAFGAPEQAKAQNLQQIQGQIDNLNATIRQLQKQVQDAQAQAAAAKSAAAHSGGSGGGDIPDLKVKWKGAPEFSSSDGKFKMKVRGRVLVDAEHIDQDERITGFQDVNGAEIRRARLGIEGVVWYDWKYIAEVDFAGDSVAVKDAFLQYTGWPVDITIGNYRPYNALEELTSSNYITFMERAAFIEAFTIDRQVGVGLSKAAEHWTAAAGVFSTATEADQTTFFENGATFSTRVTVAPINREGQVVHLGASYRHRDAPSVSRDGETDNLLRYRARGADFHLADRFVDTGNIGDGDSFWGLEGAVVLGPFSVQAEYSQDKVDVPNAIAANVNPTYTGWYADASFFLTGESRPYNDGIFGRVKVKNPLFQGHGWGAWQIAGRYDVIDLSDEADAIAAGGVLTCSKCGEQKTWLVGLNWYVNDYVRFMLNVNQSKIDGGVNDKADITGVGARAQIDW